MQCKYILLIILAALTGVTPHPGRHRRVPHVEVERTTVGNFTVLESRILKDGRRLERVQEHAEELPELPATEELVNDLGDVDSEGRVLVPLDEDGNVPQEYKHLLEPVIHEEMKYEDIIRLNNTEKVVVFAFSTPPLSNCSGSASRDGSCQSAAPVTVDSVAGCEVRQDNGTQIVVCFIPKNVGSIDRETSSVAPIAPYAPEDGNDDIIDQGAEYDEPAAEPEASLPKANDYHDSQEVDPDLARAEYDEAEPETVETVAEPLEPIIPSEELKKLEEQIRIKADLEKEALKEANKKSEEIVETEDKVIEKEEEMKDIEDDLRRIEETADTERQGEPLTNEEDDKESGKKQLQMEEQKGPETKESKEDSTDTVIEAVQLEVPTKVEKSDTNKAPENERKQEIPVIAEATNAVESPLPSEDVTDDKDIDAELMEIVFGAFSDHHINYGPVKILKKGGASWEVQPEAPNEQEGLVKVGGIIQNPKVRTKPRPDSAFSHSIHGTIVFFIFSFLLF